MSSSSSPCAACKFLRRKCTLECVFAPYFPPDQPQKFSNVHKVFGASNVAKILNELSPTQREDAVNSLAYEADARLQDPVYGCVGRISILQSRLRQVQRDLYNAKKELAAYISPSAMLPLLPHIGFMQQQQQMMHYNNNNAAAMLGGPPVQMVAMEAQQMSAAAREQHEMMRSYDQQQLEMARFSGGFDQTGMVVAGGFCQMPTASVVSASLALGSSSDDMSYQVHESQQEQFRIPHHQLQLHSQPPHLLQQLNHHEEGSVVGP